MLVRCGSVCEAFDLLAEDEVFLLKSLTNFSAARTVMLRRRIWSATVS